MRKVWALLIVVLLLSVSLLGYQALKSDNISGFTGTGLETPSTYSSVSISSSIPNPRTNVEPPNHYGELQLSWEMTTDVFEGYGGVLNLTASDSGAKIFIYRFGIQWLDGPTYLRNCSVSIDSDESTDLGTLIFGAPLSTGQASYTMVVELAAYNYLMNAWYDYGKVPQGSSKNVNLQPLETPSNYSLTVNPQDYYDSINSLVNFNEVMPIVNEIRNESPGQFSVQQIVDAYSWMKQNIEYQLQDQWPNVSEVLSSRTADCKGQSILMASIVTALGGSTRIYIIEDHAFPAVFVATNATSFAKVKEDLANIYGSSEPNFHVAYILDRFGYWLIIDPNGFPYCGGIPAMSGPISATGDAFQILSTFLIQVDVTGKTSGGLLSF
jgi:hypothetical protein